MLMHKAIITTSDSETDISLPPLMEVFNKADKDFWYFDEDWRRKWLVDKNDLTKVLTSIPLISMVLAMQRVNFHVDPIGHITPEYFNHTLHGTVVNCKKQYSSILSHPIEMEPIQRTPKMSENDLSEITEHELKHHQKVLHEQQILNALGGMDFAKRNTISAIQQLRISLGIEVEVEPLRDMPLPEVIIPWR